MRASSTNAATDSLAPDTVTCDGPLMAASSGPESPSCVHSAPISWGAAPTATIEVNGYQMATALNEELLTEVAETTAGSYHRAQDAQALEILREVADLLDERPPGQMCVVGQALVAY